MEDRYLCVKGAIRNFNALLRRGSGRLADAVGPPAISCRELVGHLMHSGECPVGLLETKPKLAEAVAGHIDLIVCNPPYIRTSEVASLQTEVSNHESFRALDGGPDGTSIIRDVLFTTPQLLLMNGDHPPEDKCIQQLWLEVGDDVQAEVLSKWWQTRIKPDYFFNNLDVHKDFRGANRFLQISFEKDVV
eukprot:Platyproteum_vivax@DN5118_c0_g1_i2.p1